MKGNIKTILLFSVSSVILLAMIGFSSVKRTVKPVNDVSVQIESSDGNYFTDRKEILNLLNAESSDYVLAASIGSLDLKMLESRVEEHPFIKEAQVYKDLKGNLMVNVKQARPIARILNKKGGDKYIDAEGYLIKTLARQTARVPIIELERSFSWEENVTETVYGQQLLELLHYIDKNEFWRSQIAELIIEKDGQIIMLPQVTKQEIVFGMPEDLDGKFKKLKLFYKEILPNKGWNTYSMVNVKFKNQIVCE
ncbi:MAG: cell division protein FtsQ [Cyclobacteriaceae bacterium]